MADIEVDLPESLKAYADAQVSGGRYSSVSDYLRHLVHADQQQQQLIEQFGADAELTARIEEGLKSGEGRRWSPAVLGELREQVLDRDRRAREER